MYQIELRKRARRQLVKLARRNPQVAQDIFKKIEWLGRHAEEIEHERLKGREEFSLHIGQYRVPYNLDYENHMVIIEDIGKHNAVYRRLRRR